VFEKDTEPYALERDSQIREACKRAGVECIIQSGHTLWDVEETFKANHGHPTLTLASLMKVNRCLQETDLGN